MTRGFDDLTLTFYKQNYVTMTKTIGDAKVKHISVLILKIIFYPYLDVGSKYTRLTLYLGTESK